MRTHEGASRTCGNTAGRDVDGFTLGSTVAGKREQQQQREQRTHRLFRHPGLSNSFFAFRKRSAVRRGGRRKGGERIGRGDATRGDGQRAAGNGTCRVAVPFVCAHSQLALAGRVRLSGTGTGSSHARIVPGPHRLHGTHRYEGAWFTGSLGERARHASPSHNAITARCLRFPLDDRGLGGGLVGGGKEEGKGCLGEAEPWAEPVNPVNRAGTRASLQSLDAYGRANAGCTLMCPAGGRATPLPPRGPNPAPPIRSTENHDLLGFWTATASFHALIPPKAHSAIRLEGGAGVVELTRRQA